MRRVRVVLLSSLVTALTAGLGCSSGAVRNCYRTASGGLSCQSGAALDSTAKDVDDDGKDDDYVCSDVEKDDDHDDADEHETAESKDSLEADSDDSSSASSSDDGAEADGGSAAEEAEHEGGATSACSGAASDDDDHDGIDNEHDCGCQGINAGGGSTRPAPGASDAGAQ